MRDEMFIYRVYIIAVIAMTIILVVTRICETYERIHDVKLPEVRKQLQAAPEKEKEDPRPSWCG